jgi:hypothetical protein
MVHASDSRQDKSEQVILLLKYDLALNKILLVQDGGITALLP